MFTISKSINKEIYLLLHKWSDVLRINGIFYILFCIFNRKDDYNNEGFKSNIYGYT